MAAPRWASDGWDAAVRIGLLVPHADVGPESEMRAMAPPGVGIHAARVRFGAMGARGGMDPTIGLEPVKRFAEPPELDDAAELLAAAPLHVIAYGFTSSAYVIGAGGEADMVRRLGRRTRGIPVVTPCAAAVEALHALDARRIAIFDPPWFDAQLVGLGRTYYEDAGFDVVAATACGLPSDQTAITPDALHRWIVAHAPADRGRRKRLSRRRHDRGARSRPPPARAHSEPGPFVGRSASGPREASGRSLRARLRHRRPTGGRCDARHRRSCRRRVAAAVSVAARTPGLRRVRQVRRRPGTRNCSRSAHGLREAPV